MQNFGTSPLEILACEAMLQGKVFLDQFTYSAKWDNSSLTATGTIPVNIQIDGDSDFVMQAVNLTAFTNATTVLATPNFLITIARAGSGRVIMNQPQHIMNLCGNYWNNSFPGVWPMPGLLQAKNTTTVTLQNLSGVAPLRVDVALVGFKVFYRQGATRTNVFNLEGFAL